MLTVHFNVAITFFYSLYPINMSVKSGFESSASLKDGILCVSACVFLSFIYLLS